MRPCSTRSWRAACLWTRSCFLPMMSRVRSRRRFCGSRRSADGVFVVCAPVLLSSARDAVSVAAEEKFTEECLLETEDCLFAVLPEGERGAKAAETEVIPRIDRRRHRSYARVVICTCTAPHEMVRSAVKKATEAGRGQTHPARVRGIRLRAHRGHLRSGYAQDDGGRGRAHSRNRPR